MKKGGATAAADAIESNGTDKGTTDNSSTLAATDGLFQNVHQQTPLHECGMENNTPKKNEADKSAGLPHKKQQRRNNSSSLVYSVLRQDLTVVSPLTILSEGDCKRSLESLYGVLMREGGMRDDYLGFIGGGSGRDLCDVGDDEKDGQDRVGGGGASGSMGEEKESEEHGIGRRSSRVRFHDDTKKGSANGVTVTNGNNASSNSSVKSSSKSRGSFGSTLPVRVYKPPSRHLNCSLGLTLFYVAVPVEDVSKLNNSVGGDSAEKDAIKTFQQAASVLLPGISLDSVWAPSKQTDRRGVGGLNTAKQEGIILLTVGTTGPAYDLYGASSVFATLPQRLRDCMGMLSALDTTPKMSVPQQQQQQKQLESDKKLPKGKSKKGKGKGSVAGTPEAQPQSPQSTFDSAYFKRLYMALLATLVDDEDGLMRKDDDLFDAPFGMGVPEAPFANKIASSTKSPIEASTPTGKTKLKRFTFSRNKVGKAKQEYESGESIAGGEALEGEVEGAGTDDGKPLNAADIVRRTALQLEVLSLAEDEMSLPKYEHAGEGDRKRAPLARSPKAGSGGSSGRFGRREVPSDLAGFDYRPMVVGVGGTSLSGTASTSVMGTSSDDASVVTGDGTATITSRFTSASHSSVPTLSKPKKDSFVTSVRSRFVQKRKVKSNKAASTDNARPKPPLIPREKETPPQAVFDPFLDDDGEEEEEEEEEVNHAEGEAESVASASTKDTPQTPASPQIVGAISRSYSEDGSEGVRSVPESATSAPSTPKEVEEEEKPVRHLNVDLALNEDLTCEYKKSKLSSISVEGTVQVRVKTSYEDEEAREQMQPIPFYLIFQDGSSHIKALQENKKFVEHVSLEGGAEREFTYSITVPREEQYFPVVRYKCSSSLRPVPIRVQNRVRTQGKSCRVALQISSNPQNPNELVQLTIIMGVPSGVRGESLQCNPPGGVWNEAKSVVLWCVSELGGGEKFQLQAIFDIDDELLNSSEGDMTDLAEKLEFPVLARCQCSSAQLSNVMLEVSDVPDLFPAEVSKSVIRRFRVAHKEK
eukprot:scaffold14452_cov193-Alexandrium_tamarense.AAC.1